MHRLEERVARLLHGRPTTWRRRSVPWQPKEEVIGGIEPYRSDTGYVVPGETLNVFAVKPASSGA